MADLLELLVPGTRVKFEGGVVVGTVVKYDDTTLRPIWTVPVKFDGDDYHSFIFYKHLVLLSSPPDKPTTWGPCPARKAESPGSGWKPPQPVYEPADVYRDPSSGCLWKRGRATSLYFCMDNAYTPPEIEPKAHWVPYYTKTTTKP